VTIPISPHELRETLTVWRKTSVNDEYAGTSYDFAQVGTINAKVSQPTAAEQIEAQQAGSNMTMIVHMGPNENVLRGDELRRTNGDKLRVRYTIRPSDPVYLRADCEQIQPEGQQ
jgi:head-tail adaptor